MVWEVQPGDGDRVGAVVDKMVALGAPSTARVFLNGRPAERGEPVDPGDRVELWPHRAATEATDHVRVIAQRDGLVLVDKPAGLPTETTRSGEDSVVSALLAHFKGGKVHVATRLDVGVSGVLIATLGRDANRRLEQRRQEGRLEKIYLAIASGRLEGEGEWTWRLGKQRDRGGRFRSHPEGNKPREAMTRWRALAQTPQATVLRLEPVTGRMHQLRAHASLAGHPLFGDRLYGGPTTLTESSGKVVELERIALHAWRVGVPHLSSSSPVPDALRRWWESLGGSDDVWDALDE
jgi:23S rRNA-/tRNA-specific pseudouridylate synthase